MKLGKRILAVLLSTALVCTLTPGALAEMIVNDGAFINSGRIENENVFVNRGTIENSGSYQAGTSETARLIHIGQGEFPSEWGESFQGYTVTYHYRDDPENDNENELITELFVCDDGDNDVVGEPEEAPAWEGHRFQYWCSDEACTTRYDTNTPIKDVHEDFDLYAKWTDAEARTIDPGIGIYTAQLIGNDLPPYEADANVYLYLDTTNTAPQLGVSLDFEKSFGSVNAASYPNLKFTYTPMDENGAVSLSAAPTITAQRGGSGANGTPYACSDVQEENGKWTVTCANPIYGKSLGIWETLHFTVGAQGKTQNVNMLLNRPNSGGSSGSKENSVPCETWAKLAEELAGATALEPKELSFSGSGQMDRDITIQNAHVFFDNVTIGSGKTLTIKSGSDVVFEHALTISEGGKLMIEDGEIRCVGAVNINGELALGKDVSHARMPIRLGEGVSVGSTGTILVGNGEHVQFNGIDSGYGHMLTNNGTITVGDNAELTFDMVSLRNNGTLTGDGVCYVKGGQDSGESVADMAGYVNGTVEVWPSGNETPDHYYHRRMKDLPSASVTYRTMPTVTLDGSKAPDAAVWVYPKGDLTNSMYGVGTCGEGLAWKYTYSDKSLTISGRGAMADYGSEQTPPWYSNDVVNITGLVIGKDVTHIGTNALRSDEITARYGGTKTDWAAVTVGEGNSGLKTVVCTDGSVNVGGASESASATLSFSWSTAAPEDTSLTVSQSGKTISPQNGAYVIDPGKDLFLSMAARENYAIPDLGYNLSVNDSSGHPIRGAFGSPGKKDGKYTSSTYINANTFSDKGTYTVALSGTEYCAVDNASSLADALSSYDRVWYCGNESGKTTLGNNATVASGKTLYVAQSVPMSTTTGDGSVLLKISDGHSLTVAQGGTLRTDGDVTVLGALNNGGTLNNNGTIRLYGFLYNYTEGQDGTIQGGTITNSMGITGSGCIYNKSSSTLQNVSGEIAGSAGHISTAIAGELKSSGGSGGVYAGLVWRYEADNDGSKLTIENENSGGSSGSSVTPLAMVDYSSDNAPDWTNFTVNQANIDEVIIGNDVSCVGENTFANCVSLKNVTIGQDVTGIGAGAFGGCTLLEALTIERNSDDDKALAVGAGAFASCGGTDGRLDTVSYGSDKFNWNNGSDGIVTIGENNLPLTTASIICVDDTILAGAGYIFLTGVTVTDDGGYAKGILSFAGLPEEADGQKVEEGLKISGYVADQTTECWYACTLQNDGNRTLAIGTPAGEPINIPDQTLDESNFAGQSDSTVYYALDANAATYTAFRNIGQAGLNGSDYVDVAYGVKSGDTLLYVALKLKD